MQFSQIISFALVAVSSVAALSIPSNASSQGSCSKFIKDQLFGAAARDSKDATFSTDSLSFPLTLSILCLQVPELPNAVEPSKVELKLSKVSAESFRVDKKLCSPIFTYFCFPPVSLQPLLCLD